MYYRTVLNAPHVNAVLLAIIVLSLLGSVAGLGRSTRAELRKWLVCGAAMAIGSGGYLIFVVNRYLRIRDSASYDPAFFDGWNYVLAMRIVLYICVLTQLPVLFSLQMMDEEGALHLRGKQHCQ